MSRFITELKPNEVFVFGSNSTGFHGAGAAGYACRGEHRNTWRQDPWFCKAMISPVGSFDRIGKWAVYGVSSGLQVGLKGLSYAIITVTHPGQRRSIPLERIRVQVEDMIRLARNQPHLTFLIPPFGGGYNGYSLEEVQKEVWDRQSFIPSTFTFL